MDISKASGIPKSKILYEMKSKEDILGMLVSKFLNKVTEASDEVTKKLTDNKTVPGSAIMLVVSRDYASEKIIFHQNVK